MHYRETVVWTRAMQAAKELYRLAPLLPREEMYGMRAQMTRAAVSVPSNIAEGWTRESKAEKRQFLAVAQGSLAELETQLTLCEEIGWLSLAAKPQLLRELHRRDQSHAHDASPAIASADEGVRVRLLPSLTPHSSITHSALLLAGLAVLGVLQRAEHRGIGLILFHAGTATSPALTVALAILVAGRERR